MPTERVSILVSRETRDWLAQEAARLVTEAERAGGYQTPYYRDHVVAGKPAVSLESMLLVLLDERQRHRERRRAAKKAGRRRQHAARAGQLPHDQADGGHDQADGRQAAEPPALPRDASGSNV